jgi:outer membrane protein assembly factor BamB
MDEKVAAQLQYPQVKHGSKIISNISMLIFSISVFAALLAWLFYDPTTHFVQDVPGMDRTGNEAVALITRQVKIGDKFSASDGRASAVAGDWPSFRGKYRDNISGDTTRLADTWGQEGPKMLWQVKLGEGHAAASVHNGRVYLLDYDETEKADTLRCLSLDDGKEIWRRWYSVAMKRNHGMSRTIPVVTDRYVVTIGPNCHVMCARSDTGELLWGKDLHEEYGSEVPLWYSGQCPLIENDVAVIAVGGKALFIGVDCETGRIIWETPNPDNWKMSHSSIMPMAFHGKRMYVYCAQGGMIGVSAEARDAGTILFKAPELDARIIAPSPVITGESGIFTAAGYGYGSIAFTIKQEAGVFKAEVLSKYKPTGGLASEIQTPVFFDGHLFCILPKDSGVLRDQFACADTNGAIVWTSGKTSRFGLGPFILADGKFYILSDDGTMTMARASANGYEQLDQFRLFEGIDSWGPIALAGGRMILRDSTRLFCFDMR